MTEQEWLNNNQLSLDIWNKKYRYNNESFEEFLDRVSHNYTPIKELIRNKKFIFGGRILANRGVSNRHLSLSNCYVITPPEDNLESIVDTAKKLARTYSFGGGCGIDVSKLAPKGAIVHNAAKTTTGAVSFMDFFSYITGLICQEGRRGALMISIDCNHPDLIEFINLKSQKDICTKANISVRVSDKFMQAVLNDEEYTLHYYRPEGNQTIEKIIKAKEIFHLLALRNWEWAEPGILYWDRIQGYNLLDNTGFKYAGVNPCAEEPLPAGGSCLLGSINLSEFVINPFTNNAKIDYEALEEATSIAVVGLNQVLIEGLNLHPLKEQQETVRNLRQIGLGTLGLADMLIKLGITYGSDKSINTIKEVYKTIATMAIRQSLELAKSHSCYPVCDKDKLVESNFIKNLKLDETTLNEIKEYGLYNSQLLTCAPTGSIGTMLEVSTGVEPNFALHYTRKTQSLNGKDSYYEVNARILADYLTLFDTTEIPDYFVTSSDINPLQRIKVQSELQKYIDASISSTINLPKETTVEEVENIYINAWKYGLKGVTVYRSGCKREGILTTGNKPVDIPTTLAPKRPVKLPCDIYKVKVKGENFIVCVGLYDDKPYEIFVFRLTNNIDLNCTTGYIIKKSKRVYKLISKDLEVANLLNTDITVEEKAATLYSSMLLRHGVSIKHIIKTAKKVNDNISSFSSAMCRVLNKYTPIELEGKCPECGADLIYEGGCVHCTCGWSKCE